MYNNEDLDDSDVTLVVDDCAVMFAYSSLLVATACRDILALITSAKEVVFSSLSVCLLATLRKNFQTDLHEISGKIGNGSINK